MVVTSLLVAVLMIGAVCIVGPDVLVAFEREAGLAWRELDQFGKTPSSGGYLELRITITIWSRSLSRVIAV